LAELVGDRLKLTSGGASRALTVRAALAALDAACSVVLVHDAARPFVTVETVRAVVVAVTQENGAVAGVPLADTLKRADPETNRVLETVDRRGLWRAQTPQGFPRAVLEQAFGQIDDAALAAFTDDAAVVEAAGFPVSLVLDRSDNIKITSAADFALAESLAAL
jgi:2-C-methyl-D-erythritol 4-phosphate cytidylyltransferase/2-C-methyl-D-erythritol 2,4-cyclodiphosphate synthase